MQRWVSVLEPGDVLPPPAPAAGFGALSHRRFGSAGGSQTSVERLNGTWIEGDYKGTGYSEVLAACAE